jgi:hypothetical protein
MRRSIALHAALAALALVALPLQAQSYEDLAGGWVVRSWTLPDGTANDSPQPGLILFTATGQYSITYVQGTEPRANLPEEPTDAQFGVAYQPFVSNAGRYRLDGDQLTYEAFVAKHPNYMAEWDPDTGGNAQTVTMSLNDGTLTLVWESGLQATLSRPPGLEG